MSGTAAQPVPNRPGWADSLTKRQLEHYPETRARVFYLAITVLATITLYYELYVGGSVSTLLLTNLHMNFTFYVITLAFGALIGAFGSLFAGLTDRLGRANLVVFGLFFTGVFVAFILPAATDKWTFTIESFVVGFVEGVCLVATPALIRDFSPQVGRATAMGFWTSGPVLGSLIVSVVGTATIPTVINDPRFWTHEYRICGIAGLIVFVIALVALKDANGLGNWNWGFNAIGVILIGVISDRFRVRKPFMVIGGAAAAVMTVIYLEQAGHHPSYYTLAIMLAVLAFALGVAYTPWMASFTETVEARNPALTATGLAIWGWIIRIVVMISFFVIPVVINTVTPLVNYGGTVATYAAQYKSQLAFAQSHANIVALAQKDSKQLADAQRLAPELAIIQANQALFTQLATFPDPTKIPPKLAAQAVAAAGGGAAGIAELTKIQANKDAINGVIAAAPELQQIAPFGAQLTALSKVPPSVFAYLQAHGAAVQKAAATTASQWKNWYWVCFGSIIFFLLSIPLLRGRWRTRDARRDEAEHEAKVDEELAKMKATV